MQPLMCPEGPIELKRRANRPCSAGAVYPKENVSIGFNRRLHRPNATAAQTLLTSRVLNYPNVPLALDVDGLSASPPDGNAYYLAPPQPTSDGYDDGAYWIPGLRHAVDHATPLIDPGCGDGTRFDYSLLSNVIRPFLLAGGLTPENIAASLTTAHPMGVDVCTGVEAKPGIKDHDRLKAFIDTIRSHDARH